MLKPIYVILIVYGKILLLLLRYMRRISSDEQGALYDYDIQMEIEAAQREIVTAGDELMDAGVWETNEFRGE